MGFKQHSHACLAASGDACGARGCAPVQRACKGARTPSGGTREGLWGFAVSRRASSSAHSRFWERPGAWAVGKCVRGRIWHAWVAVRRQAACARGCGATRLVVGLRTALARLFGGVGRRVRCARACAGTEGGDGCSYAVRRHAREVVGLCGQWLGFERRTRPSWAASGGVYGA